jgi:hypothetical protein
MRVRRRSDVDHVWPRCLQHPRSIVKCHVDAKARGRLMGQLRVLIAHRDNQRCASPAQLLKMSVGNLPAPDERNSQTMTSHIRQPQAPVLAKIRTTV